MFKNKNLLSGLIISIIYFFALFAFFYLIDLLKSWNRELVYQTGFFAIFTFIAFALGCKYGVKKERNKSQKEVQRANIPSTNIKPPVDIK